MSLLDDFGLTDEQLLIRRNVAELLARVLPAEDIRKLDADSAFPHAAFDALAAAGYREGARNSLAGPLLAV